MPSRLKFKPRWRPPRRHLMKNLQRALGSIWFFMIKVAVLSLDYDNLPEVVFGERFLTSRHVSVFLLSNSAFGAFHRKRPRRRNKNNTKTSISSAIFNLVPRVLVPDCWSTVTRIHGQVFRHHGILKCSCVSHSACVCCVCVQCMNVACACICVALVNQP